MGSRLSWPSRQGAAADEFLLVVEGQRGQVGPAGVGAPLLDESFRLRDLRAPLRRCPVAHGAVAGAEVAVEVGAYLVPFEPGPADVGEGRLDVLVGEVADVRGATGVVRGVVEPLLRLGQQIQPGEEEGHVRVVLPGEVEEAREEAVADLAGTVPGEDHELRRGLTRLQRHRLAGLVGLLPGEGGGAVTDGPGRRRRRVRGLGSRGVGHPVRPGEGSAPREPHGGCGARTDTYCSPSGERVHASPIRHVLWWSPSQRRQRRGRFRHFFRIR